MASFGLGKTATGAAGGSMFGPVGAAAGGALGFIGDLTDFMGQSDYEERIRKLMGDVENPNTPVGRSRVLKEQAFLGDVNKASSQASGRAAAATGERGMGASGYSTGAQTDVLSQMALARLQARSAAREQAFREGASTLGLEGGARGQGIQSQALDWGRMDQALSALAAMKGLPTPGNYYQPGAGANIRRPRMVVGFDNAGYPIYE